MSVYIDPKDQSITTDDVTLYKAWNERKELRLQHFKLKREIEELDKFIETYVARVQPKYETSMSQWMTATITSAGTTVTSPIWVSIT